MWPLSTQFHHSIKFQTNDITTTLGQVYFFSLLSVHDWPAMNIKSEEFYTSEPGFKIDTKLY